MKVICEECGAMYDMTDFVDCWQICFDCGGTTLVPQEEFDKGDYREE